jgi:hypothetical protein
MIDRGISREACFLAGAFVGFCGGLATFAYVWMCFR